MKRIAEDNLRQRKCKKIEKNDDVRSLFGNSRKQAVLSLPDSVGYGFIFIFIFLIKFFYVSENILPDQLKIKNADLHPDRFIGERAELQLRRLTNLGTRVVGSYENEVLAVDFLKREISFISQKANHIHTIEVDIQRPSGSYYLTLKPFAFKNYYANIQNVVVKLSSGNSTNSVLINCHYDTVPESPGASDNGLNCAVMLEILRVLAGETTPLKHNVIFLFNGAEENPLQASHGFLSDQKWRHEVKVVINLDSAGAGGREILFQTSGESWLVKVSNGRKASTFYSQVFLFTIHSFSALWAFAKSVPQPSAAVQAEELFQYGVIPSDTDFRIFRDFGGYPGFDIAHCTNGYIYHTKFDTVDHIQPGVYQNTGDNMLALVRELANSSELEATHSKSRIVYFDLFTLFMVAYTEEFGVFINLATVFLSFFAVFRSLCGFSDVSLPSVINLSISVGGQLLGLLLAAAIVFFTAKTLDYCNSTMSWYLRPALILPLYCFPILFALAAMLLLVQTYMKGESLGHNVINLIKGAQILWTIVLLVGTLKGIRSSFTLMLIILFPTSGILFLTLFFRRKITVKLFAATYLMCLTLPLLYTMSMSIKIFTVIIPMTARMGPHTNPETVIGVLAFLTSTIYLLQIVPFGLLLKNMRKFLVILGVVYVITMIGVVNTKYGFPYSGDVRSPAVQRFYILHCERTFHDARGSVRRTDSGIFVQSLDRNNLNFLFTHIPELQNALPASRDCQKEMFCGFPVFTSRFIRPAPYSYWMPSSPPTIHHPTAMEILNQTQVSVNVRRIRILVTGPDHITVGLSPRKGVELLRWSFDESIPRPLEEEEGRKTYLVYYSHGLMGGTLEFDVDLQIAQNHSDQLMNLAVIGHYMHDKKFRTSEFKSLLAKFPDWTHPTSWTTTYKSWEI